MNKTIEEQFDEMFLPVAESVLKRVKTVKTIGDRATEQSYAKLGRLSPSFEYGYNTGAEEQRAIIINYLEGKFGDEILPSTIEEIMKL